ncbi:hypothetical protein [Streptomyces anulatus]|uniref:hypothetical protein n=1 Tax=Streptomyces anulatus TaxID=1892 RepID=UPI0033F294CC
MPRRDDIVTIVIATKNEMKRSVDGLGSRVNDLERDLRPRSSRRSRGWARAPWPI